MIKKILKYISRTVTYTILVILITFGLGLLFVFVTSKVAKSQKSEPPINLFTIISPSMTPNINVYDVVVAVKTDPSKIKTGDVISFYSDNPNVNGMTITHRVVQVYQDYQTFSFRTKGDFNKDMDPEFVAQDKIVGKVYFKIPQLGRVQFFLGSKGGWLIAILIPALAIISYDIYKIIKLIIVKQKILSYKKIDDATKTEISTNPIVADVISEMPNQEEKQETSNVIEPIESILKEEPKIESVVEEPIISMPQHFEEIKEEPVVQENVVNAVPVFEEINTKSEVNQIFETLAQPIDSIQADQFEEPLVSESQEIPEEIKPNVSAEPEIIDKEKQEEILVISD